MSGAMVNIEKLYKLSRVEPVIYQKSMDWVRLNDENGYHLNPWTVEELAKTYLLGLPDSQSDEDLVCGISTDQDGFISAVFSHKEHKKRSCIQGSLLPSMMKASESEAGGYTLGCLGKELARIYMDKFRYFAVAKTGVPRHWNQKHETDVYFMVKSTYIPSEQMKFDAVEHLLPMYPDVFEHGIPILKYIGKNFSGAEIPKFVKSGEMLKEKDIILRETMKAKEMPKEGMYR